MMWDCKKEFFGAGHIADLIQPYFVVCPAYFIPSESILPPCGAFIGATGDDLLLAENRAIDFYLFW